MESANQPQITQTIRAIEWWEYKLCPILASMYATAWLLERSVFSMWPLLLFALAALIPGAAYVSVINDATDLEDDAASGKANRLAGKSPVFVAFLLAACVLPGAVVAWLWRSDGLLLGLYGAAWTAFSLYSLPPFRLKNRGAWGVLADACGAHLFPTLVVVTLVFRHFEQPLDTVWFGAVAAWAFGYGLRGILWHQLSDLHHDAQIGLHTFVQHHQTAAIQRVGNFVIFPVEVAAFALMLWRAEGWFVMGLLGIYALLELFRKRRWSMTPVIVTPKTGSHIAMHEFYEVFYPLGFLLSSCWRTPADAVIIVFHLLLFPRRAGKTLHDGTRMIELLRAKYMG